MRSTANVTIQILAIIIATGFRLLTPSVYGPLLALTALFVLLPQLIFALVLLGQRDVDDHTAAVFVWLALLSVGLAFLLPDFGADGVDRAPLMWLFGAHAAGTQAGGLFGSVQFWLAALVFVWFVLWCYAMVRMLLVVRINRPVRRAGTRRTGAHRRNCRPS
jgi:hypothetical protein